MMYLALAHTEEALEGGTLGVGLMFNTVGRWSSWEGLKNSMFAIPAKSPRYDSNSAGFGNPKQSNNIAVANNW